MSVTYNLDLLFAALIVCLCMAIHAVATHTTFKGCGPRLLYGFMAFSFLDAGADIVASLFIQRSARHSLIALYLADVVLYMAQACLAYLLFVYCIYLTGFLHKEKKAFVIGSGIFCFIALAIVITTPITGWVFSFDPETHAYAYGMLRPFLFFENGVYGLCCLILMAHEARYVRFVDLLTVGTTVVLTFVTAIMQALFASVAVTGFAAVLGTLLLYMAMLYSTDMRDAETGLLSQGEFRRRVASLTNRGDYFNITVLSLSNRQHLRSLLGSKAVSDLFARMSSNLMGISSGGHVYRLEGPTAALITYRQSDATYIEGVVLEWLSRYHLVRGVEVRADGRIVRISNAVRVTKATDVEAMIGYVLSHRDDRTQIIDADETLISEYRAYQEASVVLKDAVENNSFEIALQPLIEVRRRKGNSGSKRDAAPTTAFASCEVLTRLKAPDGSYIPPDLFIDLAEKTGSIHRLTIMQFERLCAFMEENAPYFVERNIVDVKFNLSALDFASERLADELLECMERHAVPASVFTFEITESVLSLQMESLGGAIDHLREAGCRIFLDDFGSGYANLEIINRVPLDGVKLDMSLLRGIPGDPQAARFYRGIVDVLHHLGKKVVAEGVSSKEQADLLIAWNVDMLQGFYYARPVLSGDLLAFLDSCAGTTQVGWAGWLD